LKPSEVRVATNVPSRIRQDGGPPEDSKGYRIILQAPVTEALDIGSPISDQLCQGAIVHVLQVVMCEDALRHRHLRAQIEMPSGWINVVNLHSGQRWAEPLNDPVQVRDLSVGDATQEHERACKQKSAVQTSRPRPRAAWISVDPRSGALRAYPRAAAERLEAAWRDRRSNVPLCGLGVKAIEDAIIYFQGEPGSTYGERPVQRTLRGGKRDVRRQVFSIDDPETLQCCVSLQVGQRRDVWRILDAGDKLASTVVDEGDIVTAQGPGAANSAEHGPNWRHEEPSQLDLSRQPSGPAQLDTLPVTLEKLVLDRKRSDQVRMCERRRASAISQKL